MVDEEVEIVLREIRERVLSAPPPEQTRSAVSRPVSGNRAGDSLIIGDEGSETASEALARIGSYLTTTGRAWDRLPPVFSDRRAAAARLELWLKSRFKSLTRWFTWEQVNFNAAVHHALRDTTEALSDYQRALEILRAQIRAESEARRVELDKLRAELEARRNELDKLRAELKARRNELENHQTEINALRAAIEAQRIQREARLLELVAELRERDDRLQNEQRVCFKQLSLETSEAAVLEDRARRKGDVLLEELTRRMEELEKRMTSGK
jgi:hypothetical protein